MICTSSEEGSDVELKEEASIPSRSLQTQKIASSESKADSYSLTSNQGSDPSSMRGTSPCPSLVGEDAEAKQRLYEEEKRRFHLQLYLFVLRCITTPFNAKQSTDMVKKPLKINPQQLEVIKGKFSGHLNDAPPELTGDPSHKAVSKYFEAFLKSKRLLCMVRCGGCSFNDLREVFKSYLERAKLMSGKGGCSDEMARISWLRKLETDFESEEKIPQKPSESMGKEQLYDLFQNILGIKRFEHQLLYNACQLDSSDEQTATIRRELDGRIHAANKIESLGKFPKFYRSQPGDRDVELERQYIDELQLQVSMLMANLDTLPLTPRSGSHKLNPRRFQPSPFDQSTGRDSSAVKVDVVVKFKLKLIVIEAKGLNSISPNKRVYCTMEAHGGDKFQTEPVDVQNPVWETSCEYNTSFPLPQAKIKLYAVNTGMLSIDDKELAKVIITPTVNQGKTSKWYLMTAPKNSPDQQIQIKVFVHMSCPSSAKYVDLESPGLDENETLSTKASNRVLSVKHCGYLWAKGLTVWKKWKERYFMLLQVTQCSFVLCAYIRRKAEPTDRIYLEGYTVDYMVPDAEYKGGTSFFNAVREGDSIVFASEDEQDRVSWVQAMYRATGQSHKPVPPTQAQKSTKPRTGQNEASVPPIHAESTRSHGMDEFVAADPCKYDQSSLFELLQRSTLEHRMKDDYASLGWLLPGQIFVLDEYCARYGVRGCHRHLCYLADLLDKARSGSMIDPNLLHYSYAFCSSHIAGKRPDGIATITLDELDRFRKLRDLLRAHLIYQVSHFRCCFPFGRPQGAFKSTLLLIEKVEVTELDVKAPEEIVEKIIRKCLQDAARINYTEVTEHARLAEGLQQDPAHQLQIITHVAGLCTEVLSQNEEYYYEAYQSFSNLMIEHEEAFWKFFSLDLDKVIAKQIADTSDTFTLFEQLNNFLNKNERLKLGQFHCHLRDQYAPLVIRYIDKMESSIKATISHGFEKSGWDQNRTSYISEGVLRKLSEMQAFPKRLNWPDEIFVSHIEHRLKLSTSDMLKNLINRSLQRFIDGLGSCRISLDFVFTKPMCDLLNLVLTCCQKSNELCKPGRDPSGTKQLYHVEIEKLQDNAEEETKNLTVSRFDQVLQSVLTKLAWYDQGSLSVSFLSFTKPSMELSKQFDAFMTSNTQRLVDKIEDDNYVWLLFTKWYSSSITLLRDWIDTRSSLHVYQLKIMITLIKCICACFESYGVQDVRKDANCKKVYDKLRAEEAQFNVTSGGDLGDNVTITDFNQAADSAEAS